MVCLLLAEDEPALLEAFELILTSEGHQVQAVTSGTAALEALRSSKENLPDLIITDMQMPGMMGLQLLEIVRADACYSSIPFLIISAALSDEVERHLTSFEATTCLPKPFDIATFCETVDKSCQPD